MLHASFQQCISLMTTGLLSAVLMASCRSVPTAGPDVAASAATGETCAPELTEIDFGIISTESQENLKQLWDPFLVRMSEAIGRPVNGFYATDYAGVIEAMGAGKIQIARYGGKSYIEAAQRSNAEAFAQTVASDGSKGYYAYLITHKDNPLVRQIDLQQGRGDQVVIEKAAELTFAFNDPNSTSGFLVPTYYLFSRHGINPNSAFKELLFAGSHEATAQAVANNQVDVATNNSEAMARLKKSDPAAAAQVQIIWTSPVIPSNPIAYRRDLPSCLKAQLKDFFLNIEDEQVLGPLDWAGFAPASDANWDTIRELELGKALWEVQNDARLSQQERQQQIDRLNQQLEALR